MCIRDSSSYEGLKYEIANLLAYSGNSKKTAAYELANGDVYKRQSHEYGSRETWRVTRTYEGKEYSGIYYMY